MNAWVCYDKGVEDITLLEFKSSVTYNLIHVQRATKSRRTAEHDVDNDKFDSGRKRIRTSRNVISLDITRSALFAENYVMLYSDTVY